MDKLVLIAGTPKSGSSTFFSWLGQHPDIRPSKEKETRFFLDKDYQLLNKKLNIHTHSIESYFSLFPGNSGILLDATPHYFYNDTPLSILPTLPLEGVFFFLFREPAERIYSSFRYSRDTLGLLPRHYSFTQFVEEILGKISDPIMASNSGTILQREFRYSCYDHYLEKWLKKFPEQNIHCLLFDELKNNSLAVMVRTCEVLGINSSFYENFSFTTKNLTLALPGSAAPLLYKLKDAVKIPTPFKEFLKTILLRSAARVERSHDDQITLQRLSAKYQYHNRRLAELSGLDLSCWKSYHAA